MKTIVMTGGTSGLGEITARILRNTPGVKLLLGARGSSSHREGDTLPLDLARLASVRNFAAEVSAHNAEIDALVLNAGLSRANADSRTVDGFETTFAVNHLAHYLLLRLLSPCLADRAIVILTTSGAHDPAERTPIPPPRHAHARLFAHPDQDPELDTLPRTAGGRAYASSKLCNVLTARAFAAQPETQAKRMTVIAYNPGPTPGTRLLRDGGLLINLGWRILGGPLRHLLPRLNSRDVAGQALAGLALGTTVPPAGKIYASLRRGRLGWIDPSELARRDDVMLALWRDSLTLAKLDADIPQLPV